MRVRPYCEGYENGCGCTNCDERRHFEEHEWHMYLANLAWPTPLELSLDEQPF